MTPLRRLAFIGNSLPRRCGIATFTTDLQQAVAASLSGLDTFVVAMTDGGLAYDYPSTVRLDIDDGNVADYVRAAHMLNTAQTELVSLQHEFGIFGGDCGEHILALLSRLTMPVVTTLHTVLDRPSVKQRSVFEHVIEASARVIVMAEKGHDVLRRVYRVPADKIEVIPHGIPDVPFAEPEGAKAKLGFAGRSVILTFGLLSPNKGIEVVIDAMPAILEKRPDAVYVVLGATHPNLVRDCGEAYRESLIARSSALGLADRVVFLDQFVDQPTLLQFISMCDVYVSPYLNEAQMTSGTLAYSFGLGKAVVSTPYWHARELLADGRGLLVPFGNAPAAGRAITSILTDDDHRQAIRRRAYASSRSMTWENTAQHYLGAFESARRGHRLRLIASPILDPQLIETSPLPQVRIDHLLTMCDDTGLLQHAVHAVPDRSHGYCIDDNARALLLACAFNGPGETRLPEVLTARFASFVQHAWNSDLRRFRNFMGYDRHWLEEHGSEDSHGRTLWALGECARSDANPSRRQWALGLFAEALASVEAFQSPRAWAFALLGLDGYCATAPSDRTAARIRNSLAGRLLELLATVETDDWIWFEDGLSYDNARLCQALIVTGMATGNLSLTAAGLRTLRWLMTLQTSPGGRFAPVGTEGFGDRLEPPKLFDQQPLEASATISACIAAWRADGDVEWKTKAACAFEWFLGGNSLSAIVVDIETGSCRDGLHADRPNENRGGESVLSYLFSLTEIRQLARISGKRSNDLPLLARSA